MAVGASAASGSERSFRRRRTSKKAHTAPTTAAPISNQAHAGRPPDSVVVVGAGVVTVLLWTTAFVCVGSVTVFVFAGVVTVFVCLTVFVCVTVFVLVGSVTVVVGVVGVVVVDFVCAEAFAVWPLGGFASLSVFVVVVGAVLLVPAADSDLSPVAVPLTLLATLAAPPEPHATKPNTDKPIAPTSRAKPAAVLFEARQRIPTESPSVRALPTA